MAEVENKKIKNAIDDERPFLGLRSFEEKNKSQFGGRDKEVKELFGLDENSVLTVIFGKSGIGKTSLIKAGLIPELQQNFYFPIYIRIDYSATRTPLEQVKKMVYDKMKERDPGVSEIGDTTLWEYFHNVNLLHDLFTPVLILDQFEEIFTLGEGKKNVLELLIQLADLAENRIPLKVQEEYQRLNKTVPTHYAEHPYRVILSLREDYLARLEELKKYMPSIMNSRFRVVQMTVQQALDAAIKPGKGLINEKVAQEIIKKLPGVSQKDFDSLLQKNVRDQGLKVEPFLLSLICDRINEKRIEKRLDKITVDLVSKFNVTDVIHSFYNETIVPYGEHVERAIEDCLLTEGGFRKLQALEEFQHMYDISDEVVAKLVDARILRKEIRDGVDYIELIHDVLAPVIKGKRNKRARLELEEKRQRAIILAKKKQRARLIRITSIIGIAVALVLAMTSGLAYWNYGQKRDIERQNKKMALARDLITTSKIVGQVERKTKKAAQISRLAYLIYNNSKKEAAEKEIYVTDYNAIYTADFYNAMYVALKNDGFLFFENRFNMRVRSLFRINENKAYVGSADGTLYTITSNSEINMDTLLHTFNSGFVTGMDMFQDSSRSLLAITGTFDSVFIHDFELAEIDKKIALPNGDHSSKSVTFLNENELMVAHKESVLRWNLSHENPLKFYYTGDTTITAVKYNYIKDSLIVGNIRGEVFTVSVRDSSYTSKKHLAHAGTINDIAFSPDGKWIATSGDDNMVVIWDSKNWNALPIRTNTVMSTDFGYPNSVSFTLDSNYLLVGYENEGTILKWPVSLDMIEQLICEETGYNLTDDDWKKIDKENLIIYHEGYDCR